jgi:hypothetical protein
VEGTGTEVVDHREVGADLVAASVGSKAVRGGLPSER